MKCSLLKELYVKVVLTNFEEGFMRKGILWSLKSVTSREEGFNELLRIYNDVIKVIEKHLNSKGQLEKLIISKGEVVDQGVKLSEVLHGIFIRGLCYLHNSQYFIRLYLKSIPNKLILTMYGDLYENTPWLTELLDPNKLRLTL